MFCKNCGKEIQKNDKYCTNCGSLNDTAEEVATQISEQNNKSVKQNEDDKKANLLCILSLISFFGVTILESILNIFASKISATIFDAIYSISSLCILAGLTLMIVARVKYPNNKFVKIVMWIYIVTIGLGIVSLMLAIISCGIGLRNCA